MRKLNFRVKSGTKPPKPLRSPSSSPTTAYPSPVTSQSSSTVDNSLLLSFDEEPVMIENSKHGCLQSFPESDRVPAHDFLGANDDTTEGGKSPCNARVHPQKEEDDYQQDFIIQEGPNQEQQQQQEGVHHHQENANMERLSQSLRDVGSGALGSNNSSPRLLTTQRVAHALNSPSLYTTRFTPSSKTSSASSTGRSFFQISGGPMELAVSQPTIQNVALLRRMALVQKRKLYEEVEARAEAANAAMTASMREREAREGEGVFEEGKEDGSIPTNLGMTAPKVAWAGSQGIGMGECGGNSLHLGKSSGGQLFPLKQQHAAFGRQGSSNDSDSPRLRALPRQPDGLNVGLGHEKGVKGRYEKKLSWAIPECPPTPTPHTQPAPDDFTEIRKEMLLPPEHPESGWEMSKEPSLDMAVFRHGVNDEERTRKQEKEVQSPGANSEKATEGHSIAGIMPALSSLEEEDDDEDDQKDSQWKAKDVNEDSSIFKHLPSTLPPDHSALSSPNSCALSPLDSQASRLSPPTLDPAAASRASVARRKRLSLDLRPDDILKVRSHANVQAIAAQRYYAAEKEEKEKERLTGVTGAGDGIDGTMSESVSTLPTPESDELASQEVSERRGEKDDAIVSNADKWNIKSGRIDVEGLFKISSTGIVFANDERHHQSPLISKDGGNNFIELVELGAGNGGAVFKVRGLKLRQKSRL